MKIKRLATKKEKIKKYTIRDAKEDIKLHLMYYGYLDKYELIIAYRDTNFNFRCVDKVLVEPECGDTLKDIEKTIIEYIKQNYIIKNIHSVTLWKNGEYEKAYPDKF